MNIYQPRIHFYKVAVATADFILIAIEWFPVQLNDGRSWADPRGGDKGSGSLCEMTSGDRFG